MIDELLQQRGLPDADDHRRRQQREGRPRQGVARRSGVQRVLIGLVAEFDDAVADRVDDDAEQQKHCAGHPPPPAGDRFAEEHHLRDEERRGRKGQQHGHADEQSHGSRGVDADVVTDAVDAVAVVDAPHDGHLQEEAALD